MLPRGKWQLRALELAKEVTMQGNATFDTLSLSLFYYGLLLWGINTS